MSSPIEVVFEDAALYVVNKPAGLLVHPSSLRPDETSLEEIVNKITGRRLILLHRLDRDTTGVVIFAKTKVAAGPLTRAFEDGKVRKAYLAVVAGQWPKTLQRYQSFLRKEGRGWISEETGQGQEAVTTFRVRAEADNRTLIEVLPKTGRTHQIRLHCQACAHPILGDRLYNSEARADDPPHALHAFRVDVAHPLTRAPMRFAASPPEVWGTTWLQGFSENVVGEIFLPRQVMPKDES